jgi:hypothetical protein
MLKTHAGALLPARCGADDVDLVVDVEVADEVDALGAALRAGRGQQQQREALELTADLSAVATELLDVVLVELALGGHVVIGHVHHGGTPARFHKAGRRFETAVHFLCN